MNRIDEWTQFISKCLKSETELLGIQSRHDIYQDAARASFIRVVLDQFLPSSFAVGSGRVIDASGNSSNELDIVIYRRDFPQLNLPGSTNVFLFESVLATVEVKTKVVRKTFFEALDNCASMGNLNPAINPVALRKLALRNKMILNEQGEFVHEDPLKTARFNLIGRPPTFVYAFSGYQTSLKQLKENIDLWIGHRRKKLLNYEMKSFPSVIATQGCFAWRNAAPLSVKKNFMLGLGNDDTPIRLIILQLMNALNRRLRGTNDRSGMEINLDAYINNIDPPAFSSSCGKVINPAAKTTTTAAIKEAPKEKISPPTAKQSDPAPVEKKFVSAPPEKKATPVTSARKPASPTTVEKVDPASVDESVISAPAAEKTSPAAVEKKAEPTPALKEPAPVAEETTDDNSKLETYSVFKPSETDEKKPDQAAIPEPRATNGLNSAIGSMSKQEPEIVEAELAQPEFIEPDIIEPEPETELKPELKPAIDFATNPEPVADADADADADAYESTAVMSPIDAKSITKSAVKSEPKLELEDKPEPETDEFSETIRIPSHELEKTLSPKSAAGSTPAKDSNPMAKNGQGRVSESDPDPFGRTMPQ